MGWFVLRLTEFTVDCDICGNDDIIKTGDILNDIHVWNVNDAKKAFRSIDWRIGKVTLCPECNKKRRYVVKEHTLKLDVRFWELVKSGVKNFEIRKDDRGFKVGDVLKLKAFKTYKNGKKPHYIRHEGETILKTYNPDRADTITAKLIAVCDSETWERSTATHDRTGYPVGVDYRAVSKILASYFHTDHLPEGYVVLRIEVQNDR